MQRMSTRAAWTIATLLSSAALGQNCGRIIAIGDEWLLSDVAYQTQNSQTTQLASNIASFFSGGEPANFLVLSDAFPVSAEGQRGVLGTRLATQMTSLGHTWTVNPPGFVLSVANLQAYDAVFFAGVPGSGAANASILASFVNGGGKVLVMGGCGGGFPSGSEATAWNFFLNQFGLGFSPSYYGLGSSLLNVPTLPTTHPLGSLITSVSWGFGYSTLDLNPAAPINAVALEANFTGAGSPPATPIQPILATWNVNNTCAADFDRNCVVDDRDFVFFARQYQVFDCADPAMTDGCSADLNGDGFVDDIDFVYFTSAYDAFLCP